jgi:hypothetical protein
MWNTLSEQNAKFLVLNIAYDQSVDFERSSLRNGLLVIFESRITRLFKHFNQQEYSTCYPAESSYLHA